MPAPQTVIDLVTRFELRLPAARLPDEKECLQRQIQSTDRNNDALVYALYNLTHDEIAIVEGTK